MFTSGTEDLDLMSGSICDERITGTATRGLYIWSSRAWLKSVQDDEAVNLISARLSRLNYIGESLMVGIHPTLRPSKVRLTEHISRT